MPRFGRRSRTRLVTCDKQLQKLFNEVVKYFDYSVLVGFRGEDEQNRVFAEDRLTRIPLCWGEGWDNDTPLTDSTFNNPDNFEIRKGLMIE